jgi:hypothetical protein
MSTLKLWEADGILRRFHASLQTPKTIVIKSRFWSYRAERAAIFESLPGGFMVAMSIDTGGGRLSINALARRFPNLHLAEEPPDWGMNFALRGLNSLRVHT